MTEAAGKKRILLHSCCGPCSSAVIERLSPDHSITVLYYDPNITDEDEYRKRLEEERRFLASYEERTGVHVDLIEGRYDPSEFFEAARGLENEPEKGRRCLECFRLRLGETARLAKELGFESFDSTLSVSSYKDYGQISAAGNEMAERYGVEYEAGNYKKKDGYHRSIELSEEYGLYRQDYCGCIFSKRDRDRRRGL
ncbi:MAG: epoxyqueuosine reductase QueH [Firmicutes bacterium]|nr:epoxyqueuosine reductase QueH [Bacillota bacterium]MBQ1887848.1 epoxyqueuosine reductase QueH [Bacillota bacterium]MBQ2455853.1 epoxyqueuosine reductase QueH [Bacillota bacterium]MBQ4181386.1 epoxyqueuosine reductase QueH [Bacillota bacterium]MBQ4233801.1 epoxyqueuosine reductase QueH [Bacillota bacterium]